MTSSAKSRTRAANSLFSVLFLAVFAWTLLHAWALGVKAPISIHAIIAIPGLVLSGVGFYRYRLHWPAPEGGNGSRKSSAQFGLDRGLIIWGLLLLAVGAVAALLVARGPFFVLVIAAVGLNLVPWAKVSVCRDHFFVSIAILALGAGAGLAISGWEVHTPRYPLAAWLLWIVACLILLSVVLTLGNRRERMPPSGF